ncbi:methylation-associated defense system ATP-binding protein MAD8 [Streptomyces sp. NPDC001999]
MSSSTTGLVEITAKDLREALEGVLVPRLAKLVGERAAGHCMRITEVDAELAAPLVRRLRGALGPAATVCVLGQADDLDPTRPFHDVTVTSTKLVELRNRGEGEGTLPGPLLVFVPPGTRVSAEDSFGIATFEEVPLGDAYAQLADHLLQQVPDRLRQGVDQLLAALRGHADRRTSDRAVAAYLLTLQTNGYREQVSGAAVYHFGLVPDFDLYADPTAVKERVEQNRGLVDKLTAANRSERQRVLDLGLSDGDFAAKLAGFATRCGLEDPVVWTRRVVTDRENWGLSFGNWRIDERRRATVAIEVRELGLPTAGDNAEELKKYQALRAIVGQPYLLTGDNGVRELTARFTVQPSPVKVDALQRFRVEIVSENGGPIGRIAYKDKGTRAVPEYKVKLAKLNKIDWEEGWHYVRVTPLDAVGDALDVAPNAHELPGGESERFYVVPNAEIEEPPERSAGRYPGVAQALRTLQFDALATGDDPTRVVLNDIRWKPSTPRSPQRALNAKIRPAGSAEIRLSPLLVQVQQDLLARPEDTSLRRLLLHPDGAVEMPSGDEENLAGTLTGRAAEAYDAFLSARGFYFGAVHGGSGHGDEPVEVGDLLVTEAVDFETVREELAAYAEAYAELVEAQTFQTERAGDDARGAALVALARIQQIDCLAVSLTDGLGGRDTVLLASPTHPLRALWLATWSAMGKEWTGRLVGEDKRRAIAARDSLQGALSPLGFPFVVPRQDGRLMAAADNLTPYWGAYLPSETADPRGLLGRLSAGLNLSTSGTLAANGASALSGTALADRMERYVRLHPYVRTLVMNVVNAGRAEVIADALLELQRRPATRDLTYDIRLCVTDPEAPETGTALGELLSAQSQISTAEAEPFLHTAGGGRHAKLVYSVRSIEEFRSPSIEFDAHLTVLIDAFGGEQHSSVKRHGIAHAPVHGLVQATFAAYEDSEQQIVWRTFPRYGAALPTAEGAEDLATLLSRLPGLLAGAAANVATAGQAPRNVPCTVLSLDNDDRALLYQAHQIGDWVVTIDRTLGLEYFDHAGEHGRPEYVIDYAPALDSGLGHQIMVSSNSVDELRNLLGPTARQHGIAVEERHLNSFFDQLRLLSGNLAFKLASTAPNQRTEVLGLSLARLYLDYQDALHNQIVVPLDAHPELYAEARRRAGELGDVLSFQRSDLALFHVDARTRTVTCRLVEVKCYTALDDISAYQRLKTKVAQQLGQSERILAESFDPECTTPDRVDRPVKNLALGSLLRFYLERAARHGTMGRGPRTSAHALLDSLDDGYRLEFTRSGLIFDLARSGTDRESEGGVEYHRIGSDLITELIDAIPTRRPGVPEPSDAVAEDSAEFGPDADGAATAPTLALLQLSVPRLADAEFRAPGSEEADEVDTPAQEELNRGDGENSAGDVSGADEAPASPADQMQPRRSEGSMDDVVEDAAPALPGPQAESPVTHGTPSDASSAANRVLPRTEAQLDGRGFHEAPTIDSQPTPVTPDTSPAESVPEIFLGVSRPSPQHGVLGEVAGRKVAVDLYETHTISLFGVQGGGKSYTLGSIVEMASLPAPPVNELPHPLASVVFHYSRTMDYAPEFTSMVSPNDDQAQLKVLKERYGAEPRALTDVLLLTPEAQVAERKREFPGIDVQPLVFSSGELQASHWRFLMGAVGNQSTYIRQLTRIMRANRDNLSLAAIRQGVDDSGMPDHVKQLAQERLNLAEEYIDDNASLTSLIRPGRLIIVDLRDEYIEKDEALGLFVVLMQLFAEARDEEGHFNKLVVFDEAHKYIDSPDLVAGLVETVREMRHKGMSILVASQDPPSVPISLIELSDHVILHKFTSPAWLKHLQKANSSFAGLRSEQMAQLQSGEAYVWASKSTDPAFTQGAVRVRCRPRVTRHGGATKTASGGQ